MHKIAIVEDEKDAKDALESYLQRYAKERDEKFAITWFPSALEFDVTKERFDLVCLDIEMPGLDGMEAAGLMRERDRQTPIVFVTNLAQYAIRGYDVGAIGFIVKPIRYQALRMCMDKAMREVRRNELATVVAVTTEGNRVLALDDIESVEIDRHDLTYHLTDGTSVTTAGVLREFEQRVEGGSFVRVSKSCLVNMSHIRLLRGSEIVLTSGGSAYFSRSQKKPATATITRYLGGTI